MAYYLHLLRVFVADIPCHLTIWHEVADNTILSPRRLNDN